MCNEVPRPVAVDEAGDADLLVGFDVSIATLIGEIEGLALGVGGEEFVEVRVVTEVQALDVFAVGVQVAGALFDGFDDGRLVVPFDLFDSGDVRRGERLVGEVLAGQRNLAQDAVGLVLQFGAFPAAQLGVEEAEFFGGGVPRGQRVGGFCVEAVASGGVGGEVGDARAGVTQGLLSAFEGAFARLGERGPRGGSLDAQEAEELVAADAVAAGGFVGRLGDGGEAVQGHEKLSCGGHDSIIPCVFRGTYFACGAGCGRSVRV